jgi:hypothetical protein
LYPIDRDQKTENPGARVLPTGVWPLGPLRTGQGKIIHLDKELDQQSLGKEKGTAALGRNP